MGRDDPRPSRVPVAVLIGALAVVAIVLAAWGSLWFEPVPTIGAGVLVLLLALATLGVLLRERGLGPHWGISVATVVLAATIPLAGPVGATVVGGVSYLADVRARTWQTRLFNAAMTAAVGAVGGVCYLLVGGELIPSSPASPWWLLLRVGAPLGIAYIAMAVANALCIGAMSAVVRGTRVMSVAQSALRSLGWPYLSHVVIGFLFVVLWGPVGLGPSAAVFILGPLLVAHWTIGREALARREHQETVTTFVAALEQADPASVGHSARVADLAEALGGELGVRGARAEELRYAALLHDIGMMVVRPELPAEARSDDVDYLSALSAHPQAGVNVLGGLDFLEGALPAIAHHHERWDGRGYPSGLREEEIPLAARIIAVADAFDALNADPEGGPATPYRSLTTLQGRAGTQLDPAVVDALRSLLSRQGPGLRGRAGPRPTVHPDDRKLPDHDHPSVSDSFADWQPETAGFAP